MKYRCDDCDEMQAMYGFPWVDDPFAFDPDDECVTPGEWVRWAEDCQRVVAGLPPLHLPRGCRASSYGIGTYRIACECPA